MRSVSRCVSETIISRLAGVGSTMLSAMFSARACMAATGVRSSWLTLAMRSLRIWSACSSSSAMALKLVASCAISSVPVMGTRVL